MKFHALALIAALVAAPAFAETGSLQAGDLQISGAFARATLPRAPVGGAYLTIANTGTSDDRLVAVTAPVGDHAALHDMAEADGVMTMRELPDGIPLPAGATTVLEPGSYHIMIEGLTEPLVEGERIDLVLTFEQAGEVTVPFDILAINATGPAPHHHAADDAGDQ